MSIFIFLNLSIERIQVIGDMFENPLPQHLWLLELQTQFYRFPANEIIEAMHER